MFTPFALRLYRVAVEVRGALLELGEVLDGLQRALRAEQPLDVDAAQRRRVDAMPVLVGTDVADGVRGRVRVAVGVAVEAGDALRRRQGAPVVGGIELRLGKRRHQQPQAFELLGIQDVLEQLVEVGQRDQLALRDVAQVRPRGQVDRRGKLRQQVLRQVEVEVEARQVALGLLLGFVDELLREYHAARFVMRMRQREESRRPQVLLLDLLRRQAGELFPGHALGQLDAHAVLHRLAARHGHALGRSVGQVVALRQQLLLAFGEGRLFRLQSLHQRVEAFRRGRIGGESRDGAETSANQQAG